MKLLNIFDQLHNGNIEYIDFEKYAEVQLYYGDTKNIGYNIVKNNDMLQYHYFSQKYSVVKGAPIIAILSVNFNGIKYHIGFMSIQYSNLAKTLRHRYFGKNIYLNFKSFNELNYNTTAHFLTINRTVIMPNFRGLGLSKFFQREVINQLFKTEKYNHCACIEIYSNLLHSFNFLDDSFNKIFLNTKMSEQDYDNYFIPEKTNNKAQDYKGDTKYMANTGFCINPSFYNKFKEFYKHYNIDINFNIKNIVDSNDLITFNEKEIPLIFKEYSNDNLEKDFIKINKEIKEKFYPKKTPQEEHFND